MDPTPRRVAPKSARTFPVRRGAWLAASAFGAVTLLSSNLSAQAEVTVEMGASRVGPAMGLDADDAQYAVGGIRGSYYGSGGSGIHASFLGGSALGDSTGGSFVSGLLEGSIRNPWTARWSTTLDARALAFGIRDPFPYRAFGAEVGSSVRYQAPNVSIEVGTLAGIGYSRVTLWRRLDGIRRTLEHDLWRVGTTGEVMVGSDRAQVGVAGSLHRASSQTYGSVGGRLLLAAGWGALELTVDRWNTPLGYETTGGLSFAIPLGSRMSFRGFAGRSNPDPLTLTQPGSGSGGALLGWTVYSGTHDQPAVGALYEIVDRREDEARIRVTLDDVPEGAETVQVLGDFTLWDPVPMQREGPKWTADIDVRPGTHHYGFLVDDEWYLPDDAPDAAPDEWGRMTATLVIEGAGS